MQCRTIDSARLDFAAWHYTAPGSNHRVSATVTLLPADPAAPDAPRAWRYTVSLDNPATGAPARIWSEGVHRGNRAAAIYYTNQIARGLRKNKVLHGSRYASRRTAGEAIPQTAAMRAALARIKGLAENCESSATTDLRGVIADICDKALSAPARNCDRYRTLAESVLASGQSTAEALGLNGMGQAQLVRFVKWLFAPAEGDEE